MAKVELKQPIVDEVSALLDGAKGAILVTYRGITVDQDTKLRKELRESGVIYKVFKNTLVRRAVQGTEFESLSDDLTGPLAIAISKEDATAPARIINKYLKDVPSLSFKSGVVEGTHYDQAGMATIATIPGREELLGRFLGSIQAPITNFARVLNQIAEKGGAAACLANAPVEEKAEEAEAPAEAPEQTAEAPAEAPAAEVAE